MSDHEGELQFCDEEEEGVAAKPARNPVAPTTAVDRQAYRVTLATPLLVPPLHHRRR